MQLRILASSRRAMTRPLLSTSTTTSTSTPWATTTSRLLTTHQHQHQQKMSVTAQDFAESDEQLRNDPTFPSLLKKYSSLPSEDVVHRTVQALEKKKHRVRVVNTAEEAVAFMNSLLPDGASYSAGGSTTLNEIGWGEALMKRGDKINNLKGKSIAAAQKKDMALQQKYLMDGSLADLFVSSVSAVTEEGDLFAADLTGTRINGWYSAKHLLLVAGTNKIVPNEKEADARLHYQYLLESARVRVAFKVPSSAIANKAAIKMANPFGARTTVLLIRKSLGF